MKYLLFLVESWRTWCSTWTLGRRKTPLCPWPPQALEIETVIHDYSAIKLFPTSATITRVRKLLSREYRTKFHFTRCEKWSFTHACVKRHILAPSEIKMLSQWNLPRKHTHALAEVIKSIDLEIRCHLDQHRRYSSTSFWLVWPRSLADPSWVPETHKLSVKTLSVFCFVLFFLHSTISLYLHWRSCRIVISCRWRKWHCRSNGATFF